MISILHSSSFHIRFFLHSSRLLLCWKLYSKQATINRRTGKETDEPTTESSDRQTHTKEQGEKENEQLTLSIPEVLVPTKKPAGLPSFDPDIGFHHRRSCYHIATFVSLIKIYARHFQLTTSIFSRKSARRFSSIQYPIFLSQP